MSRGVYTGFSDVTHCLDGRHCTSLRGKRLWHVVCFRTQITEKTHNNGEFFYQDWVDGYVRQAHVEFRSNFCTKTGWKCSWSEAQSKMEATSLRRSVVKCIFFRVFSCVTTPAVMIQMSWPIKVLSAVFVCMNKLYVTAGVVRSVDCRTFSLCDRWCIFITTWR